MSLAFARSEILLLLALLPLWWWWTGREGAALLFARSAALADLGRAAGPAGRSSVLGLLATLPTTLRAGAIASLLVVLAGPTLVRSGEVTEREEIAIVLAVDVSSSMLAEDMEEGRTRMEVAKETAARFVGARSGDRIGVVAFSGEAFTRVPPTDDPALVLAGVDGLETGLLRDGTDISGALVAATNRLAAEPHRTRVVVLLTDGAHNASGVTPLAAAEAARANGVKVYAVSVLGVPADTATGEAGRIERELRRAQRRELEREIETVLTRVARESGGRYWHASGGAALDSVYGEIDRLETTPVGQARRVETRPAHALFLLGALLLLSGEALFTGSRWKVVP